jgi:hypothetical protein
VDFFPSRLSILEDTAIRGSKYTYIFIFHSCTFVISIRKHFVLSSIPYPYPPLLIRIRQSDPKAWMPIHIGNADSSSHFLLCRKQLINHTRFTFSLCHCLTVFYYSTLTPPHCSAIPLFQGQCSMALLSHCSTIQLLQTGCSAVPLSHCVAGPFHQAQWSKAPLPYRAPLLSLSHLLNY